MDINKEVTVKLLLTEKEVISSHIYLQRNNTIFKAICISIMIVLFYRELYEMSLFVIIILSIFLLIVLILAVLLGICYRAKKEYKSNDTFQKESTMIFNDPGYTLIRADNNHNYRKWDDLHSIRETKSGFFLYYSSQVATYISKRCFSSANNITSFKTLVLNHLSSGKVSFKNTV